MKQILKFKIIIILAIICLFYAPSVFAAEALLESGNSSIPPEGEFEVGFFLNTDNQDINAIEGKIIFPEKLLEMKEIRDGGSIVNFWIERPEIKNGGISFSGITPGGYIGKKGLVFSIIFQSIKEGQGQVQIQNVKTLRNDGKGTLENTTISNLQFIISEQALNSQAKIPKKDTGIPEAFKPVLASDPTIFDGKYFLVFATQDKESGIDHYEVKEGSSGNFIVAESPYLLQNQKLDQEIFVKAIDKSNNEQVEIFYPPYWRPWYKNYWIIAIILAGLIVAGAISRKTLWQKFIKR